MQDVLIVSDVPCLHLWQNTGAIKFAIKIIIFVLYNNHVNLSFIHGYMEGHSILYIFKLDRKTELSVVNPQQDNILNLLKFYCHVSLQKIHIFIYRSPLYITISFISGDSPEFNKTEPCLVQYFPLPHFINTYTFISLRCMYYNYMQYNII